MNKRAVKRAASRIMSEMAWLHQPPKKMPEAEPSVPPNTDIVNCV